jgi:hypothetical protein
MVSTEFTVAAAEATNDNRKSATIEDFSLLPTVSTYALGLLVQSAVDRVECDVARDLDADVIGVAAELFFGIESPVVLLDFVPATVVSFEDVERFDVECGTEK